MRAICVDKDGKTLRDTLSVCREARQLSEVEGFTDAREALRWLESHPVELAILDIDIPGMDGLALARAIRERDEKIAILFLTDERRYALDAWQMHATGYVLKPLTGARLSEELDYAAQWRGERKGRGSPTRAEVKTFGNFDLLVDGEEICFSRSKAKELLACLVDHRGIRLSRSELFRLLWGEEEYTRPKQKMLDVILRSLRKTLEENGVGDIVQMEQGKLRIVPEKIDCDYYRLLRGERDAIRAYRGEYMCSYAWASVTEGYIESRLNGADGRGAEHVPAGKHEFESHDRGVNEI